MRPFPFLADPEVDLSFFRSFPSGRSFRWKNISDTNGHTIGIEEGIFRPEQGSDCDIKCSWETVIRRDGVENNRALQLVNKVTVAKVVNHGEQNKALATKNNRQLAVLCNHLDAKLHHLSIPYCFSEASYCWTDFH